MRKIKTGDNVIVLTGRDKGSKGNVLRVIKKKNKYNRKERLFVIVQGLNLVSKCVKADPQQNIPGKIKKQEARIDISNVAIFNQTTDKAERVGFKILEDGKKVRVFKSNSELIDSK